MDIEERRIDLRNRYAAESGRPIPKRSDYSGGTIGYTEYFQEARIWNTNFSDWLEERVLMLEDANIQLEFQLRQKSIT